MMSGKSGQQFRVDTVYFWRLLPQGIFSVRPQDTQQPHNSCILCPVFILSFLPLQLKLARMAEKQSDMYIHPK